MMEIGDNRPAGEPPLGIRPNFIDPPSQAPAIIALEAVFLPLMLLAVLVRIFVRARITHGWGWDACENSGSINQNILAKL